MGVGCAASLTERLARYSQKSLHFPPGEAEVTVTAEVTTGQGVSLLKGQRAAEGFEAWLAGLLKRLPKAPVLAPAAMDRAHIYAE